MHPHAVASTRIPSASERAHTHTHTQTDTKSIRKQLAFASVLLSFLFLWPLIRGIKTSLSLPSAATSKGSVFGVTMTLWTCSRKFFRVQA